MSRLPNVAAWRNVELGVSMPGGSRNPVYRASRGGDDLVVRVSGRSAASLEWELDLLDHLAARGVRVPVTLESDDGRRHIDGVLVQRFIAGSPPRDGSDWKRIVETIGLVHDMTRDWPQRPGFASARTLLIRSYGGDVDLGAMPAAVSKLVRDTWRPQLGGQECVIHCDLSAGNVLMTADQVALIDWDEARVDVPAFDYTDMQDDVEIPDVSCDPATLRRAGIAWETATCWAKEPDYARRCLADLQTKTQNPKP